MLLVMDTAKIFQSSGGEVDSQLWRLTWDRISTFLPHLKDELFKPAEPGITLGHSDTHLNAFVALRKSNLSFPP
ncbi:hypothetical protein DPMN_181019 [Dreissena polymorpha]|uniref:Uncharacterized protein n=1 Tax=Dreissena polymorpha TaxID=45954 RepID=A0A9D4DDN0_DREPO|nr:hypothetical protein DPMN_181019 [Dreissena polymorpha]